MTVNYVLGKSFSNKFNLSKNDTIVISGTYFFRDINFSSLQNKIKNNAIETLGSICRFLDGSFFLFYYDDLNDDFWFVTDPYGLNKVFYQVSNNVIKISDDINDFFDDKIARLDTDGINEYLRFLDISPPKTCYEGIFVLDGSKYLRVSLKTKKFELYNSIIASSPISKVGFSEAVNNTRSILVKALERRLEKVERVGLFLSGGVDSSILAALYSELINNYNFEKVKSYAVGFNNKELDESPIAEAVASNLGISHEVLKFDIEQEYYAFFNICSLLDVPFADPAVIPTYLTMNQMRLDGITSVMEGTGADGLIGATLPKFYNRILKIEQFLHPVFRNLIADILRNSGDPFGYLSYFDFENIEEKFIRWKGWKRKEIEKLCGQACDLSGTAFYRIFKEYRNGDSYDLYRKLLVGMPDSRITDTCRLLGLQPVFPFFDQELRDFVESLPREYKSLNGENKRLFKALLAQYVPRDIWDVPKHGFDYPFEKLLLYRDADLVNRYLNRGMLEQHNLFSLDLVMDCKSRFIEGDTDLKFKIWALVVFQAWYDNFYRLHGDGLSR